MATIVGRERKEGGRGLTSLTKSSLIGEQGEGNFITSDYQQMAVMVSINTDLAFLADGRRRYILKTFSY